MKPIRLSCLVAALLSLISVCGAETEPEDLAKLRTSYQAAKLQAIDPLTKRYVDSLHTLKLKYTQAGNLEGAVATDNEVKFASDPFAPEETAASGGAKPAALPEELATLRSGYKTAKAQAIDPFTAKYVAALDPLKIKYTQLGNLQAALAIDNELKLFQKVQAEATKPIQQEPIKIEKLMNTQWRLPDTTLPGTPDRKKWVRFKPNGALECGWTPAIFSWKVGDTGALELRPFKNGKHVLTFIWNNLSSTATIIDNEGVVHKVSELK
jgi:hypothetical protein